MKTRILLVIVLVAGYMFASPYITANRMLKALRNHDGETLSGYIDFDAVQQGLRKQLQHLLEQPVPTRLGAMVLTAIGAPLQKVTVDEIIGLVVTAESLTVFLGKLEDHKQTDVPQDLLVDISMGWRGLGRFAITIKRNDRAVDFILERRGFSWQLIDALLPLPPHQAVMRGYGI